MPSVAPVARALTWAVAVSLPAALIVGPLASPAFAGKTRALAPVYTTKPANPTNATSATFTWTKPLGYSYTCWRDGSKLASCASPVTLSGLANGSHTFTVKSAVSGARPTTSSYSWRVDTIPPAAPSVVAPPSPTKATSVSVAFSDSDSSVTKFTCALDSGTASACTSPFAASGLAEGAHTVKVAAYDAAGNVATSSTSWVVDLTAPDVPVVVGPPSPTKNTSASVSFSTSDAATFTCNLDGSDLGACASPDALAGLAEGPHTFTVTAHDLAGNATPNHVSWVVDTTAPSVPSLVNGPADPTDDTSPTVQFTDFDPSGVTYSCTVTDVTTAAIVQGPEACASPYAVTAATTDGDRYQVAVVPTDGAGNTGPALDTAWTVNLGLTPAPPALVAAPPSPSNVDEPTFSYVATDIGQTGGSTGFLCSVDGAAFAACGTPDPSTPTSYGFSAPLADGAHTFAVETTNGAAQSSPATWSWTVDTTAPAAPAVVAPDPATTVNPTITFGDTDPTVTYACSIDGGAFVACSSPWTPPSGLDNGSHSLVVEATDAAGNTTTAGSVTFTVQNAPATLPGGGTAPVVSSITVPTTLTGAALVRFSEAVTGLATGGVRLVVTGTTATISATTACLSGSTAVSCASSYTSVRLTPRVVLVPGQHYTVLVAAAATHDLGGDPSSPASSAFRAARSVEESNVAVRAAWQSVRTSAAYGGNYVREHLAGATASWTFTGTAFTWWTVTGPTQGKAYVYVDGVRKAIVNNYATATHFHVARSVTRLRSARHTVRIAVLGLKGATAGTGTFVAVDGFSVGRTRYSTPVLVTTLRSMAATRFSGGRAFVGDLAGEALTLTFRGTGITWMTMRAPNQGIARVYVDGVLKATYDDYAAVTSYPVARSISRLRDSVHTVRIVVTGLRHRGARGALVTTDRFLVA